MYKFLILLSVILMLTIGCGDEDPRTPPSGITSVNGDYYLAIMGGTNNDRPMSFIVRDVEGEPLPETWVHFKTLIGDGHFTSDSMKTLNNGQVTAFYYFSGSLGHAELMAYVRNVDSVTVSVRANMLKTGAGGQGQFILFNDTYEDIITYNGNPEIIDVDPTHWVLYVVYEQSRGVVFAVDDVNRNNIIADSAEVFSVIVNNLFTPFAGKTSDSIGLGSTKADFEAVYGLTNYISEDFGDGVNPPAWEYKYPDEGISFFTDKRVDVQGRQVFEMHLWDPTPTRAVSKKFTNLTQ